MGTRLGDLVERFGGQLVGDPNLEVQGIAPLDSVPRFSILGLFPTLQSVAAQLAMIVALIFGFGLTNRRQRCRA